jgi:hypothetical protein
VKPQARLTNRPHLHLTVQYSTVQYSTVQYSTVQYSTVQFSATHIITPAERYIIDWNKVHCATSSLLCLHYLILILPPRLVLTHTL